MAPGTAFVTTPPFPAPRPPRLTCHPPRNGPKRTFATMVAPSTNEKQMHVRTPLIESPTLSRRCGHRVVLKLDNVQPSGSFKIRGHGHLCATAAANGVGHFISSSGGNAGAAVAYAGLKLGVRVTIVVPGSTPGFMIERLKEYEAEVVVFGEVWDEADGYARELARREGEGCAIHISPFDDPLLWAGHASLVEELKEDLGGVKPGAVVVSVGGGGLFLGVAEGLRRVGWDDVTIVAAETEGAESFARMVEAGGEVVRLGGISSIAKSLGALAVSEKCAEWVRGGRKVVCSVVSDKEAVEGCSVLAVKHRVLVEPACGAAVAAAMRETGVEDGVVVVVVCGGNMVSPGLLQGWIKETGATEAEL